MSAFVLLGRGVVAEMCALSLLEAGVPFRWFCDEALTPPPPLVPELALLPGPSLSLSHIGQQLWQDMHLRLGLEEPLTESVPFHDIASTPGREAALRQEALLDALAGAPVEYRNGAEPGLMPALVRGTRFHPALPWLREDAAHAVADYLVQRGQQPVPAALSLTGQGLRVDDEVQTGRVVLAEDALASRLWPDIGLLARRRHRLEWPVAQPVPLPVTPLALLHRMPKGHLWVKLEPQRLSVVHDGVADARQHTLETAPDMPMVAALMGYLAQLLPGLRQVLSARPQMAVATDLMLPDGLPYLGPHPVFDNLLLAGGGGARQAILAPALALRVVEMALLEEAIVAPLAPGRRQPGQIQVPESLMFEEPTLPETSPGIAPTVATPVLLEGPEVHRAEEIRMIEKVVESRNSQMQERSRKPKVQMASLKTD